MSEKIIRKKIADELSWWLDRRDFNYTEEQLLIFVEKGAYAELLVRVEDREKRWAKDMPAYKRLRVTE